MASPELVVVPPERRREILGNSDQLWLTDFRSVDKPTVEELHWLMDYVSDNYPMAPQKCWWPPGSRDGVQAAHNLTGFVQVGRPVEPKGCGVKVGIDDTGIFLHGGHQRRHVAVASTAVGAGAPPPPETPSSKKEDTVAAEVAAQLRLQLMQETFKVADKNGDGFVSKSELGLLLRRVAPAMAKDEIDAIFSAIDTDHSHNITNGEFCTWLSSPGSESVRGALESSMANHKQFIQASFRLWDKNGDGSITRAELFDTLKQVCPRIKQEQLDLLFSSMDTDHSDQVDYEEFVEFLWGGR